ncbi:unnamed protein product, partial [Polarella glacialis]
AITVINTCASKAARTASRACGEGPFQPVDLAISHFPGASQWSFAGTKAYHTSVVLEGTEYCFRPEGIVGTPVGSSDRFDKPPSHVGKPKTRVFEVGLTRSHSDELVEKLDPFFQPGSYDLVNKNCNAFTDCALAFLLSRRLPRKYSAVERSGQSAPELLLSCASVGRYKVNASAAPFNLEAIILKVDANAWMGTAAVLDHFGDAPTTERCAPDFDDG